MKTRKNNNYSTTRIARGVAPYVAGFALICSGVAFGVGVSYLEDITQQDSALSSRSSDEQTLSIGSRPSIKEDLASRVDN